METPKKNENQEEEAKSKRYDKLCRRCKLSFDPSSNTRSSCRFHPSFFVSRRHDDQKRNPGAPNLFDFSPKSRSTDSARSTDCAMFTNDKRQAERTGKYGSSRAQYLQELVIEFQKTTNEESKEKIVAHLANFAYDPYNYAFLRQLNVLELFLDCITEPNEKLVEFGAGGICNSSVDPANAAVITQCGGIPLMVQCLSSPVRNTVSYALGALYYLCNSSTKKEILKPEVVEVIRKYAAAGAVNVSFSNLANAFLDKHVIQRD